MTRQSTKCGADRYRNMSGESYDRPTFLSSLIGPASQQVIGPKLAALHGLELLELGCGSGKYTKIYCHNNTVLCVDRNPHLFRVGNVCIREGDATELHKVVEPGRGFDGILSFFMTEYLSPIELRRMLLGCFSCLRPNGFLLTTMVTRGVLGSAYVLAARQLRGVQKHSVSKRQFHALARECGYSVVEERPISRCGLEFAVLFSLVKPAKLMMKE